MKKILLLLVVSILLLSGLGAVAISYEKQIENKPLNTLGFPLEIKVEGGLLGYKLTATALDPPIPNGSLSMTITTKAWIMLLGGELSGPLCDMRFGQGFPVSQDCWMKRLIGFGPANVTVEARYTYENGECHEISGNANGFVFLIYVSCEVTIEPIP